MESKNRTFLCIDMKTFYASVECAERGLNPFETNLVVADKSRGKNALCLAISPKMKAQGVKNRCRLSEIPKGIKYEIALPRMQLYIDYAADIYDIYLDYFDPADIHVYSIDESFIDVTDYLRMYNMTAKQMAKMLMNEIANRKQIPSTAGIGTNLFLAKVALDITAKHSTDHMGYLDEEEFKRTLWDHTPITDFWMIARGTANRLARYGITTMRGVANAPVELLHRLFGINYELLYDHAWGREPCLISDIKEYKGKSQSVSFSQILPRDYTYEEAKTVLIEMVQHGCLEMMRRHVITHHVSFFAGYSHDEFEPAKGSAKMVETTALFSKICPYVEQLYEAKVNRNMPIRRLGLCFDDVCDEGCEGYDLFTNFEEVEKEKAQERAVLEIKDRFGKNAILRGTNFMKGATQRERNEMIGGHRAGYDDPKRKS